ncbi:sestrin homolog isoform X2 [Episyrphus balteatus]|nr:sestrin homolog isoform X2 [Episyrphus balteatus]XP_055837061.1 sestrin homolog isoform X2 [Episyrphus balteatus]XP_055837062.1 sestrin homolog isoform X2 [Episyrphus balteatus]XP_055837063.1 sestrin homolog isoform X2 [Episyrphus balteatus]XP_055837064.1 sestrin homolog isoform X2 [Episyrphus balteatus]XP_055837065.1 sestrin homolog isoform X2 [Episyrphus balteatus]
MEELKLDHVSLVIGYHPRYLEHFLRTQDFIMRGDGPLPYDYRYYLAIIAAARHQCPYLVKMYEKEFLDQGGDVRWLSGLDFIPPKLRAIYDMNKLLAHRPWLLRQEHIECLTKGKSSWSVSEVVHAMVLLSHFHSLSSFVFSCGLTQQLDSLSSPKSTSPTQKTVLSNLPIDNNNVMDLKLTSNNNLDKNVSTVDGKNGLSSNAGVQNKSGVSVEALMERMKVLSEKPDECSEAELSNRFKSVELQTAELPSAPAEKSIEVPPIINHYIDDPSFTYQDFARRGGENIPNTFRIQDYSWDDHGYSLVNGLYDDVGYLLDNKFRVAYNLTYFTMGGNKNVDTSKFRRAIWNYIQCIYGIRHDDYDYGEVNQLLDRPLKMFIKTACCFPERITKKDYDNILMELLDSEKVHVNLMIMEARNQAELLYALREIMRYMT